MKGFAFLHKRRVFRLNVPVWATLAALLVSLAAAQPSLQARIDAAVPGDTLYVEGGRYAGSLVIDREVVLIGQDWPEIDGEGKGHVVEIKARGVTVEGFVVTGSGERLEDDHAGLMVTGGEVTLRNNRIRDALHGIYVKGTRRARIEENMIEGKAHLIPSRRGNGIHLWKSTENVIRGNTITATRDGIYFSFATGTRTMGNTVHDVRYGLHYMYSDDNSFSENTFFQNAAGAALMYSEDITVRGNTFRENKGYRGYGLLLQSVDRVQLEKNHLTQNSVGVYLENSNSNVFRGNRIESNHRGLRFTASSMDNRFTENVIRGNLQTVELSGLSPTNEWHEEGRGNFWGARGLLDLDSDGVSELPHRAVDLLGPRQEDFPYAALLSAAPGVELLSQALRRVPPPDLTMIVDEHALVNAASGEAGSRHPLALVAFFALVASVLIWQRVLI